MPSPSHDSDPEETMSSNDVPPASTTMEAPKAAHPGPGLGNQGLNKKPSSSTGTDSDHGKDTDLPSTNSPGATRGDPPQKANSRPNSEKHGDPKQGNDPKTSSPPINTDRDHASDADQSSDTPSSKKGDPKQEADMTAPNPPAATVMGNPAESGGDPEQSSENAQGNTPAIDNQIAGQAATVNGQVSQPLSNNAISIAGTTLTPGGAPTTVSDVPISLEPSAIAVGSSSLPIAAVADRLWIPGQVTTLDSQVMKPVSKAEVSIAGATLSPGAPEITVSGTPISPGSNALILGTSAVPLQTELPQQPIITVAGHISTAAPTGCSIAGTTISPGVQAVDIAGTAVSLDASSHL
ncbi:hypothetical protein OEA41_000149 [Lepraria neglecta]|uniref:Uncharacterized protein n=1 Tax=Lepraria neglecta TaxID=209136 RepID=A0AAE0DPI8_9LECA|nr:hypothetical protein OEA41_000149 [Lepraria neglecta]